jgi:hypothetical protein
MHVKLLKELLNLDYTLPPHREKMHKKMHKKIKITPKEEDDDITSNLMKSIVDANEPINLDLESISDFSDSSVGSSSAASDSFYEL